MTKEQYYRMISLRETLMSIYGIKKIKPNKNADKLFKEFLFLRRMFSECKGVINEETSMVD